MHRLLSRVHVHIVNYGFGSGAKKPKKPSKSHIRSMLVSMYGSLLDNFTSYLENVSTGCSSPPQAAVRRTSSPLETSARYRFLTNARKIAFHHFTPENLSSFHVCMRK